MTLLQVMPDDAPEVVLLRTRDRAQIADVLLDCSVRLRSWPVRGAVEPGTANDALIELYRAEVDELCAEEGLKVTDTVQFHPEDTPQWRTRAEQARLTFLEEHRHGEDEVRFFAQGTGCFYLHVQDRVLAVVCEAGDLLSVPAGTRHWFDMGPRPDFCAIRFFEEEDGWVGDFTSDPIARSVPRLDALLAGDR
ncbi:1,2-dihydroxy-3-keto-5-methylthiopentene dioxygenase [Kitasatospora viridis]|uniref:Acireductone dioxygenase n=1 Tax=Kitasatospora viridis TaxID=281105 RepID=A0A561UCP5_9ACTN|nr:cupin [Kitasatospora viridis]TWF97154.1 acireductone dioxygenase apoprotein [Kitasatospora viridis]